MACMEPRSERCYINLTFLSRFLLAQLHMDSLTDKMSIKDVRRALKRFPRGGDEDALKKAYSDAMERINAQQPGFRELAKQVLSWITYAKRELTLLELQHALAVEPGARCLDPDNLKDVGDMVSVCAGLVTIEQENSTIRLVHYTTQEYLQRIHFESDPDIQERIVTTCLTYLSFDAFQCGYCPSDTMLDNLLSQQPLLDYAAKHWGHYAHWDTDESEEIKALALDFLKNENKASVSGQVVFLNPYRYPDYSQRVPRLSGIHLCAFFGLKTLMMALLDGVTTADLLDSHDRTPLSFAASEGHEAVVKLLLDRDDVEADSRDKSGLTPLMFAVQRGHGAVVKLLLDRDDVEADSRDDLGLTPLSRAALEGRGAVVELLLDRDDVEADSRDKLGRTPLTIAANGGHGVVVKLLLDRDDVEADSKDDLNGRTPLSWAAMNGREVVVKLLLDRDDVEANSRDFHGRTPLSWAAMNGREVVVKLLLDRDDVEANSRDFHGRTPLSWAAMNGHEAVVKLLLDRDDVEAESKDDLHGRTPLSGVARERREAAVKLLQAKSAVQLQ